MNSNTKALPPVTHAEAREILGRFNNSHFRSCKTGETARYSIPANPARDDDLRLLQYIKQCEAAADLLAALMASPTPPRCTPGSSASMACRSPAH